MKTKFLRFHFLGIISGSYMAMLVIISCGVWAYGQGPASNNVEVQREAMKKLAFLSGRWSGPVTVMRGPGQAQHLTQTEDVEYKLDGLVLLVEGKSTSQEGKTEFSALATISYDDSARRYQIRAYNEGHYVDTELAVLADGFTWSFPAGPGRVVNTMHLTAKDEWDEVSEFRMGSVPPRPSVEMLLQHVS